ncbi:MAG TPA: HD domain-containing protein [Longimicrobiales bacterium]|nr:HD domain-containing protein [Longimicrobiales bacterium]
MSLHPLVTAAARGELPPWARMGAERRAHVERVADLMEDWAERGGVGEPERTLWLAAAWLHDCLKEAPEEELRGLLSGALARLPEPVLHGPAAAACLRREGVDDRELLLAVSYHTLGHPDLGSTGKALYAADFLEPGRKPGSRWRARLRERMPGDGEEVVKEILRARIEYLLRRGRPIRHETMAFWNRLAGGGEAWVRASEV